MSYEGYTEYLCEDGHHWTQDAYDERPRMCADCGKRAVWYHDVDQTNGDDDWALLDAIETAAFAQCNYGHTHQVRVARYKIPTTIGYPIVATIGSRLGETPMTDMNNCQIVSLSERIRPNSEAAPWVVEAVQKLEAENQRLTAENDALKTELDALKIKALGESLERVCAWDTTMSGAPINPHTRDVLSSFPYTFCPSCGGKVVVREWWKQ